MKFDTYIPSEILRPFIKSFVITENDEESIYKVLPDTGLVIGFQYKGRLFQIRQGQENILNRAGISGLSDGCRIFKNSPNIGTVLVLFRETGASHFFRQPLHELFRESISLDNFMLRSELLFLEEQLLEAATDGQRITVVERFLIDRMTNTEPDKLVLAALALIHKSKGSIRIKELIEQLRTSQSPLEKRFRRAVGTSPKKFASIVRLKHVIEQHKNLNSLTELGYEAGFYDQAHFIKEFKAFTGDTPERFFFGK
ncbi:MAG TPA: helix-turn-helix domain-containing protein [Chitinophagales bacterium]|nr:helix-turn-helix domain-containing protein [Chitinophagales bacterium]